MRKRNRTLRSVSFPSFDFEALERRQLLSTYYVTPPNSAHPGPAGSIVLNALNQVNALTLRPGDTVYLDGSATFNGNLRLDASDSGTAANPVRITSYGTGRATILAADADGTTVKDGDAIHVENAAGIDISDLVLVGTGRFTAADKTPAGINFLTNGATTRRDFVHIDNVDVTNFWQAGIYFQHVTGLGYNNVLIENCTVHNTGNTGIEFIGGAIDASTNVSVSNCRAFDNAGHAGLTHNSGSGIVLSSVMGGTVQDSISYGNGTVGYGGEGIWAWNAANIVIQRNESYDNHTTSGSDGGGFDLDGGVTNSVMQYNFSHDNEGSGFGLFQYRGASAWGNNVVRYNVSRNDARGNDAAGISLWNGGSGIVNADIYGNTIYLDTMNLQAGATPQAIVFASKTTNVRLFNNIFMTKGGIVMMDVARGQSGLLFQNNDFWADTGFAVQWANKTYRTLQAWQSATGQSSNVSILPMFDDADQVVGTRDDFRLSVSSILRDAGRDLWTVSIRPGTPGSRDFYGDALPGAGSGGFAIGADEV